MTLYDLWGDRKIEQGYVGKNLPQGDGLLLDLGPDKLGKSIQLGLQRGWRVIGIGLEKIQFAHPHFVFIQRDFLEIPPDFQIDFVVNVSTIEHFGIAGRYGVTQEDPDADLKAMEKLRSMMGQDAQMILTIPIGIDSVIRPWHRVYGRKRLAQLLEGYQILGMRFWAKQNEQNVYQVVTEDEALTTVPQEPPDPHYYALGTFTLRVGDEENLLHLF